MLFDDAVEATDAQGAGDPLGILAVLAPPETGECNAFGFMGMCSTFSECEAGSEFIGPPHDDCAAMEEGCCVAPP